MSSKLVTLGRGAASTPAGGRSASCAIPPSPTSSTTAHCALCRLLLLAAILRVLLSGRASASGDTSSRLAGDLSSSGATACRRGPVRGPQASRRTQSGGGLALPRGRKRPGVNPIVSFDVRPAGRSRAIGWRLKPRKRARPPRSPGAVAAQSTEPRDQPADGVMAAAEAGQHRARAHMRPGQNAELRQFGFAAGTSKRSARGAAGIAIGGADADPWM